MFGGSQTWTGSIATDGQGNLYLPDGVNGRVRRIDSSGNLTTVAGNGAFWFSGDGGSLSDLRLRAPTAAAFDGAGNLYIADAGNARIRKIGADGTVSTIAGNGSAGPLADDDGGAAIQTSTGTTSAIAADGSGNVYYADGSRIRRVDPAGIVTTMVSGPVNQVEGLAVDGQGNLYFSDENRGVVQMITTDGTLSVIAGAGGELSTPKGLAIGPDGSIYVADPGAQAVRRIAPDRALTTVAGGGIPPATGDGGAATNAFLFAPFGVAVRQDGTLFISESGLGRVRKVASDGTITTVAGKGSNCCRAGLAIADAIGDNGAATDATLSRPAGLALDATGALFIVDTGHNRVRKLVE
jgi:sugar lactone lactonase YvrE